MWMTIDQRNVFAELMAETKNFPIRLWSMQYLLSNIAMGLCPAAKTNCKSKKRTDSKLKWLNNAATQRGSGSGISPVVSPQMNGRHINYQQTKRTCALSDIENSKKWAVHKYLGAAVCSSVAALICFGFLVHSNGVFACGNQNWSIEVGTA